MEQYRLGEYIGTDSRELEQEIIELLEACLAQDQEQKEIEQYNVFC